MDVVGWLRLELREQTERAEYAKTEALRLAAEVRRWRSACNDALRNYDAAISELRKVQTEVERLRAALTTTDAKQ